MRISLRLAVVLVASFLGSAASAGAGNPQIAGLQVALRSRGVYTGAIDGVQGPLTRQALRLFQRRAGLVPDGLAGPRTRRALGRLGRPLYGSRPLRRGTVGWDVAVLQFLLARQGFGPGRPDGHFGPRTGRAVRGFQRSAGLRPDGILGPRTAAALCSLPTCTFHAPRPAPRFVRYLVEPGDTLTGIAGRYQLTIGELVRLNRLDPGQILQAGATVRIPLAAMRQSARKASTSSARVVRAALGYWAAYYGVDPHLVRALAWMESGYQQDLTSFAGAKGVMQVMPATWSYVETVLLGHRVAHDLDGNVQVGVAFLRQLLREFAPDRGRALAAYLQGPRSVRRQGILPSTRIYVADVLALEKRL